MEKWKIAVIAALLLSLVGFGVYQQNQENAPSNPTPTPSGTPIPSPYLGKKLPAWNFSTWNHQKPVSLASLGGKTALVEIFRTECPHCQDAEPFLVALNKRYGPRGLKILGIQSPGQYKDAQNPENNWPAVQAWLQQRGVDYPVAFDAGSHYFQGTLQKQFLNNDSTKLFYPTIMILGPDGKVKWSQTGHDTSKAVALAIELEKRFPSGKSVAESAANLTRWLISQLPELGGQGPIVKALTDDIAQRMKS